MGSAHPGCAQAMGEAKIIKIDRKMLLDMLQRNPEAAIEIISYLGDRLREAQENARSFALDSAEHRLATLLVNLAIRAATAEPEGIRLKVHLTRQDFADMAGLTLETTSRIMSRFKKAGMVKRKRPEPGDLRSPESQKADPKGLIGSFPLLSQSIMSGI